MRVFAGPNGSGKTTIITDLKDQIPFGAYVNADDIEKTLFEYGALDLNAYSFFANTDELQDHFRHSEFATVKLGMPDLFKFFSIAGNKLVLTSAMSPNSYIAADIAEWIRLRLLDAGGSFSYETLMSHPGKLDFSPKPMKLVTGFIYILSLPKTRRSISIV
jgi:hypothetical protein